MFSFMKVSLAAYMLCKNLFPKLATASERASLMWAV